MKYLFLTLCILLIGQAQTCRAQNDNILKLKKGSLVFCRISQQRKSPDIYEINVPLYIVGTLVSVSQEYGRVEIKPKFYVYTCSYNSEEWFRVGQLIVEKQSYNREVVKTEVWDARTQKNYKESIYEIRPYTEEIFNTLTRGKLGHPKSCPKVVAINSSKWRNK